MGDWLPVPSDFRKRTHRKVNTKKFKLISKEYYIITNELFHLCSFCHKCQKPVFYTLCLLRHRSLPYFCTACFALPRLRPFSFVFSACRLYRHADGYDKSCHSRFFMRLCCLLLFAVCAFLFNKEIGKKDSE